MRVSPQSHWQSATLGSPWQSDGNRADNCDTLDTIRESEVQHREGLVGVSLPRVMAMLLFEVSSLLPLLLPALAPLAPLPDCSSELPDPEPIMPPPPLCARACCTSRHVASSATLTAVLLPMACTCTSTW